MYLSLSFSQLWALVGAALRELLWGLPSVARELGAWRRRALAMPDAPLRHDALHSLTRKRANTDGAALFSILARRRDRCLLRLIVAYETIWDFLDNVSERGAAGGEQNGCRLHRALLEALDLDAGVSDYYRFHPWKDDGGYLRELVIACRTCARRLPSYEHVRRLLVQEARRSDVGAFNHERDAERRVLALKDWASREFPGSSEPPWFELTAAASCSAVVHILLVLAAEPGCTPQDVAAAYAAYFPWFSIAVTMLDSYVDQIEDLASGAHSYIGHYPSEDIAVWRVRTAIERSTHDLYALRDGHRHAVIAACMVAMYSSKDSALTPEARPTTRLFVNAGGSLTRLLLPILRLWRIAYSQQSA